MTATATRIVAEAVDGLGGLDGVVLNVGIASGVWLDNTSAERLGPRVRRQHPRALPRVPRPPCPIWPTHASIVFMSSVAGLRPGSRSPAYDSSKAALSGTVPPRRPRRRSPRHPRQCRRARTDRHTSRPARHSGPAEPSQDAGTARSSGHRVGGRRAGRLPAEHRRELHHRSGARRRRRAVRPVDGANR